MCNVKWISMWNFLWCVCIREGREREREAMARNLLREHKMIVLYQPTKKKDHSVNRSIGTMHGWSVRCVAVCLIGFCDKAQFVWIDTADRAVLVYACMWWKLNFENSIELIFKLWCDSISINRIMNQNCVCAQHPQHNDDDDNELSEYTQNYVHEPEYVWLELALYVIVHSHRMSRSIRLIPVKRVCVVNVWWIFGEHDQFNRDRSSVRHGTPCVRTLELSCDISSVYFGTHSYYICMYTVALCVY